MIGGSKQYGTAMGMMAIPTTWPTHTELDPRRFPIVHDPMRGYQGVPKVVGRTHFTRLQVEWVQDRSPPVLPYVRFDESFEASWKAPRPFETTSFDSTRQKSSHTPSIMPFLPLVTGRKPSQKRMATLVSPAPTTCTFENGVYLGKKGVQLQVSV